MKRTPPRKPLSVEEYVSQTVSLTERVLTRQEATVRAGTGTSAWRSGTPVTAELGAQFMRAEREHVRGLDFTAEDLEADKQRINDLERAKAAAELSSDTIDRSISFYKERVAGRVGRLQVFIQAQAPIQSGSFRANAQPLLSFTSRQTDKQTGRRRETTQLRSSIEQLSAERDLETRLGRGDKVTLDELRPLAARVSRRTRRTPRKRS